MSTQEDRKRRLATDRGVVKPRQLAHVVRRTARFDDLVRWYCTVLGADVVHSDGMLAFLTYDDEHHRIAIAGIPGLEEQSMMAAGTDHVAFSYARHSRQGRRSLRAWAHSTCCGSESPVMAVSPFATIPTTGGADGSDAS